MKRFYFVKDIDTVNSVTRKVVETIEKLYTKSTGLTLSEIEAHPDVLPKFFDAVEKVKDVQMKTDIIHYILSKYYILSDDSTFIKAVEKGLSRKIFQPQRDIIMAVVDNDSDVSVHSSVVKKDVIAIDVIHLEDKDVELLESKKDLLCSYWNSLDFTNNVIKNLKVKDGEVTYEVVKIREKVEKIKLC